MQSESSHCPCIKPSSKSRILRNNKASFCSKYEWHTICPACLFICIICCIHNDFFSVFSHQLDKDPLGTDDLETEILSIGFKAIFSWVLEVWGCSLVWYSPGTSSRCTWVYLRMRSVPQKEFIWGLRLALLFEGRKNVPTSIRVRV